MKGLLLFCLLMCLYPKAEAQTGTVELMAGHQYLHYQHNLKQALRPGSRLGWQHLATLMKRYNTPQGKYLLNDELMNQLYLTFNAGQHFSFRTGLFYTQAGGFKPTAGIQYSLKRPEWVLILSPRIDLNNHPNLESFLLWEWTPRMKDEWKGYIRIQSMSNFNRQRHNRSYQQLRMGVGHNNIQFGWGMTLDEFGTSRKAHLNTGLFIRKLIG